MPLSSYLKKRNLKISKEPLAKVKRKKTKQLVFVVQKHYARRLHYDLRLEAKGVLKSWAVPKNLSMDPRVKRLAIMVEDHPYSYKDFEGTIEAGYGKGVVSIWDHGTYDIDGEDGEIAEKQLMAGIKKGAFHFTLHGKKLKGVFKFIKLKASDKNAWLLIKSPEGLMERRMTKPLLTHLDKIYWPKEKITKGDLICYYDEISPWILPYLKDRPESLKRFPNGIGEKPFFQKNLTNHPDWVETTKIEHRDKQVEYALIQNEETLLYLANLGCIEIHPFLSRVQKLHYPDYMIFDLDPKEASFIKLIEVARVLHEVLEEIEVPSYCKTSGATGLHIAIPLGAKYSYEQVKYFAEIIALLVNKRLPKITTLERSIAKREGKIYIDCYQNNFGQTIASVYSVRARPGAPVSTPLKWDEVRKGLDPKEYTIKTLFPRLKKYKDLYAPVLGNGINLRSALKNISLYNLKH